MDNYFCHFYEVITLREDRLRKNNFDCSTVSHGFRDQTIEHIRQIIQSKQLFYSQAFYRHKCTIMLRKMTKILQLPLLVISVRTGQSCCKKNCCKGTLDSCKILIPVSFCKEYKQDTKCKIYHKTRFFWSLYSNVLIECLLDIYGKVFPSKHLSVQSQLQKNCSGIFIVTFKHVLEFLLLSLSRDC